MGNTKELKAGDWVRVKHTDYKDSIPVGSVVKVEKVDSDGDADLLTPDGKLSLFFFASEFEPWEPKVGDRVRMVRIVDGLFTECPATIIRDDATGAMNLVLEFDRPQTNAHDCGGQTKYGYGFFVEREDLEPLPADAAAAPVAAEPAWTPNVGDRVEVTYGHGWNGAGVVGAFMGSTIYVDMKTGKFAGDRGGFEARHIKPAPLTIEAGKFYKTRDGRKVGPMVSAGWAGGFYDQARRITSQRWEADGSFVTGVVSQLDLIAEWVDEPAAATTKPPVAAQVDTLAEEYGPVVPVADAAAPGEPATKPKFKVGDRVRCPLGCGDAVVTEVRDDGRYRVRWDDIRGVNRFWWKDKDFELIAPATPTTAIVCLIKNGQPKPAAVPHVHASVTAADAEAARLANKHKGDKFGVFVLTGEPAFVEKPAYAHEWQRQAANGNKIGAIRELRSVTGLSLKPAKDAVEYWLDQPEWARAA